MIKFGVLKGSICCHHQPVPKMFLDKLSESSSLMQSMICAPPREQSEHHLNGVEFICPCGQPRTCVWVFSCLNHFKGSKNVFLVESWYIEHAHCVLWLYPILTVKCTVMLLWKQDGSGWMVVTVINTFYERNVFLLKHLERLMGFVRTWGSFLSFLASFCKICLFS